MQTDLKKLDWNEIGVAKGGGVAKAVEYQISRAISDIRRAPDISTPRKVKIELEFTPNTIEDESRCVDLQSIGLEVKVGGSLPNRSQKIVVLHDSDAGVECAVYNPDSPGNPRQKSFLPQRDEDGDND